MSKPLTRSGKDYARKPELRDKDESYVEWMKKVPFRALQWEHPTKESEFKKPYLEPDHVRMEAFPQWPYPWTPDWPHPNFPGPVPTPDVPGVAPWFPGDEEDLPYPGGVYYLFCFPQNPRYIYWGESDWIHIGGDCTKDPPGYVTVAFWPDPSFSKGWSLSKLIYSKALGGWTGVWGTYVTAPTSGGDPIALVWFTLHWKGEAVDSVLCMVQSQCGCPGGLEFDDANTANTIGQDDSITVYILNGCPPYNWSVTGTDFSMAEAQTTALQNTLIAGPNACGTADVTITDECDDTVHAYIRGTEGEWVLRQTVTPVCSWLGNSDCRGCAEDPGGCSAAGSEEDIEGQWRFYYTLPACMGHLETDDPCGLSSPIWAEPTGDFPNVCSSYNLPITPPSRGSGSPGACNSHYEWCVGQFCLWGECRIYEWVC